MERLKCMAVDDERRQIELLRSLIHNRADLAFVGGITDPQKALDMVARYGVELLFVELHMESMHGLELIKQLDNRVQVICCTAYNQYGPELSELDVTFYLQKPVTQTRFDQAVDRVLRRKQYRQWNDQDEALQVLTLEDNISFKLAGKLGWITLDLVDIEYLEAQDKLVKIVYTDGETVVDYSLMQMEKRLPSKYFMRMHKSYLVALNRIRSYCYKEIILRCSEENKKLPVGDVYRQKIEQFIKEKELNRIPHGATNTQ